MRKGINHKVSHDSGPLPKTLTSVKHGSRGNVSHSVAGQPKYLRRKPDLTEREAILDSFGMTHLPSKFHATKATRRPIVKSTLLATSTSTSTTIDPQAEMPRHLRTRPGDLVPMRQSAKVQPRYRDDQQVRVTVLARECGLTPKVVIDALLKEQGEYVKSAHSAVAGPVARMFREMHPIAALLDPQAPANDAEAVIDGLHHSHKVADACTGRCAVYECKCGAKWIGHDLMVGCTNAGASSWWGCPVEREQRSALIAERTGFDRADFTLISA